MYYICIYVYMYYICIYVYMHICVFCDYYTWRNNKIYLMNEDRSKNKLIFFECSNRNSVRPSSFFVWKFIANGKYFRKSYFIKVESWDSILLIHKIRFKNCCRWWQLFSQGIFNSRNEVIKRVNYLILVFHKTPVMAS